MRNWYEIGIAPRLRNVDISIARVIIRGMDTTTPEFHALAREAFDVMMRRGWHAERYNDQWFVPAMMLHYMEIKSVNVWFANDPFTALVNADRWYRENVEPNPPDTSTTKPSVPSS